MSNYNLNQPTLPEIREKIAIARAAREFAKQARQGKSLGFRPQVGVGSRPVTDRRQRIGRWGSW